MDTTALVAIVGIALTFIAAIFAPVVGEISRRKSAQKERFLELRLQAYAELLSAGAQISDSAAHLSSLPDAPFTQPSDNELNRLFGQVRVVASDNVATHLQTFTEHVMMFHFNVLVTKSNYRRIAGRNPEDDSAARDKWRAERTALGREADAIRDTYDQLEAAIRKDVRA